MWHAPAIFCPCTGPVGRKSNQTKLSIPLSFRYQPSPPISAQAASPTLSAFESHRINECKLHAQTFERGAPKPPPSCHLTKIGTLEQKSSMILSPRHYQPTPCQCLPAVVELMKTTPCTLIWSRCKKHHFQPPPSPLKIWWATLCLVACTSVYCRGPPGVLSAGHLLHGAEWGPLRPGP